MAEHPPAPWRWDVDQSGRFFPRLLDGDGKPICYFHTIYHADVDRETIERVLQLMALAPGLLNALMDLVKWRDRPDPDLQSNGAWIADNTRAYNAIARATKPLDRTDHPNEVDLCRKMLDAAKARRE